MVPDVKDKIKDKTDKLTAAVYLVTNFLDDLDQMKWKLRTKALDLKANFAKSTLGVKDTQTPSVQILPIEIIMSQIEEISSLIDIAVLDRRASAMNFSILRDGYNGLKTELQNYLAGDWYKEALVPNQVDPPKITHSFSPKIPKITLNTDRREKILTFIKQNGDASIRDIAKFIPGVSSKTVQRELVDLVQAGQLKKTGERRWSRYNVS